MYQVSRLYSEESARELVAFLRCTHSTAGAGSLPCRLAHHGPELLRIIAEFILVPRRVLFTGLANGQVEAIRLVHEPSGPKIEVSTLIGPLPPPPAEALAGAGSTRTQRIVGLAIDDTWLVAATMGGCIRVVSLPSAEEVARIPLGMALPSQTPVIADGTAFIMGRRTLCAVCLAPAEVIADTRVPFAAQPTVAVDGPNVFVQCDEILRAYRLCDADPDHGLLRKRFVNL